MDAPIVQHYQAEEMRLIFKGRVQGVGFRITAAKYATQLGVLGTVRNLPDDSVEVIAQGSHEKLLKLVEILKEHPQAARVDSVTIEARPPAYIYTNFRVIR